jgi:glutaredoxin 3
MGLSSSRPATKGALEFVKATNASNRVVVWSKTYCPYAAKAKVAMQGLLKPEQYVVMEVGARASPCTLRNNSMRSPALTVSFSPFSLQLDKRGDGDEIQDALLEITGGRTVPRVFIAGEFIGGCPLG